MTFITINAGRRCSRLMVKDARNRSRSDFFLFRDQAEQVAHGERWVGLGLLAERAQQHGLAAPDLGQAHLVDLDRRFRVGRPWVAQGDHLGFDARSDQQGGGAVVQQQDDRAAGIEPHQVAPAQPQRPRPHAGALRPGRQRRGAGHGFIRAGAEFVGVQFQPIIAGGVHHREQAGVNGHVAAAAIAARHARAAGPARTVRPRVPDGGLAAEPG